MLRQLRIRINKATWGPRSQPPPELLALESRTTINVLHALVHTALWTRPPTVHGFHLADYWAWLRYGRAIAPTEDLRLCEEWQDLDPHQKTILSDEFGIGVTTCLLAQEVNCTRFVDTLYVLRSLLPDRFYQRQTSKVGPSKSPDFIASDNLNRFIVLECKGTQSSSGVLWASMKNGATQKRNLRPRRGTKLHMSLVGGLFLPQWSNPEKATVIFADPSWEDLSEALESLHPEQVLAGVAQMHTAKMLAVAGLPQAAAGLAGVPLAELRTLDDSARRELTNLAEQRDFVSNVFDTTETRLPGLPRARFSVSLPSTVVETLIEATDLREALPELVQQDDQREWHHGISNDGAAQVATPDGYIASLLYRDERLNPDTTPSPRPFGRR